MNENAENTTTYQNKCSILADLWLNYRDDEEFSDYMTYTDLGLPLAYAVSMNIIQPNDNVEKFVNEAFTLLLDILDIEDKGFDNLDSMFASAT